MEGGGRGLTLQMSNVSWLTCVQSSRSSGGSHWGRLDVTCARRGSMEGSGRGLTLQMKNVSWLTCVQSSRSSGGRPFQACPGLYKLYSGAMVATLLITTVDSCIALQHIKVVN